MLITMEDGKQNIGKGGKVKRRGRFGKRHDMMGLGIRFNSGLNTYRKEEEDERNLEI